MAKHKTSPPASRSTAAPGPATMAGRGFSAPYWPPVLLAFVAFLVYGSALNAGFVSDDGRQVLQNPYIRDTSHLSDMFTTNVWAFKGAAYQSNYYRPLMHVTYMLTYQTFGLKPGAFHAVNNFF